MKLISLIICIGIVLIEGSKYEEIFIHTVDAGYIDLARMPNILENTTDLSKYGIDVTSGILKFQVKACNDVNLYLTETLSANRSRSFYNVIIGVSRGYKVKFHEIINSTIVGRNDADDDVDCDLELPLLDCNEFRKFWISWKNGYVRVGKGQNENEDEIYSWHFNPLFPVKAVGIQTARGSTGDWIIYTPVSYDQYFCGTPEYYARVPVFETYEKKTSLYCSFRCKVIPTCMGFNYNTMTGLCQLFASGQSFDLWHNVDVELYLKC